eukprot:4391014-Amphidinium_carterae.2
MVSLARSAKTPAPGALPYRGWFKPFQQSPTPGRQLASHLGSNLPKIHTHMMKNSRKARVAEAEEVSSTEESTQSFYNERRPSGTQTVMCWSALSAPAGGEFINFCKSACPPLWPALAVTAGSWQ